MKSILVALAAALATLLVMVHASEQNNGASKPATVAASPTVENVAEQAPLQRTGIFSSTRHRILSARHSD